MSPAPRILVFAGSLRRDSFNKKLARLAADAVRGAGGEATLVDLADLPMPLYDGDLEGSQGVPENGRRFKKLMMEHHGLFIASPEYNSSISAVLKNTIDWASRPEKGETALQSFDGKVAALCSASTGALGGLRSLATVRSILGNIRVLVLPEQLAIPKANEAFAEDGKLKDAKQQGTLESIAKRLVTVVASLRAGA
ncbi:MAG: NADPH-dependent FMN reductase [Planctomycetota bacterium]